MSINYFPPGTEGAGLQTLNGIIQLTEEAPLVTASENPAPFLFNTIDISADIAAQMSVTITGTINPGDIFAVVSPSGFFGGVSITAASVPTFEEFAAGAVASDVSKSIALTLNNNIIFNRLFYADGLTAPGVVVITALNPGRFYNMNFEGAANFSPSSSGGQEKDFGRGVLGFSVFADILGGGPGRFGEVINKASMSKLKRINKAFAPSDNYYIDPSGVIKNEVKHPLPTSALLEELTGVLFPYSLLFGFSGKDDNGAASFEVSGSAPVKWVFNSALPALCPNDLESYIIRPGASGVKFLTNKPTGKEYFLGSNDYLTILYEQQPGTSFVTFWAEFTFTDGTQFLNFYLGTVPNSGGVHALNLKLIPFSSIETGLNKTISSFTIQASNNTAFPFSNLQTTEKFNFVLRRDCPERSKDIVFLGALGCYEGLRLTKRSGQNLEREFSEYNKTANEAPEKSDEIRTIKEARVVCSEVWASGWLPVNHYDLLKELAKSPTVYEVTEEGEFKALIIENINIDFNDQAEKYSATITIKPTTSENSISK